MDYPKASVAVTKLYICMNEVVGLHHKIVHYEHLLALVELKELL